MRTLALCFALILTLAPFQPAQAENLPTVTVWKSPSCGCCKGWVKHMQDSGFQVKVHDLDDLDKIKKMASIPEPFHSCHTARVGNYMIEGHVPASDVKRLLASKPAAHGLAAPGMPAGSPGMEVGDRDPYDVLLFNPNGSSEVFSSYK